MADKQGVVMRRGGEERGGGSINPEACSSSQEINVSYDTTPPPAKPISLTQNICLEEYPPSATILLSSRAIVMLPPDPHSHLQLLL